MELIALTAGPNAHLEERYDPIRVLWAQVLKRAIFDYVVLRNSSNLRDRRDFSTAERWLFSNDFGLVDTCVAMDWSLKDLRNRATAMTKKDIRKMEFRDRDVSLELVGNGHGNSQ